MASAEALNERKRKKETTDKFYGGQEDRKCQGEYDAPKLPIFRNAIVGIRRRFSLLEGL
jgi:hypothetical protein